MGNLQLDSLDKKILETLSQNARKPYLEIARECNVSGAAIHQRIQKLHTMGIIKVLNRSSILIRWDMRLVPILDFSSTIHQNLTKS